MQKNIEYAAAKYAREHENITDKIRNVTQRDYSKIYKKVQRNVYTYKVRTQLGLDSWPLVCVSLRR